MRGSEFEKQRNEEKDIIIESVRDPLSEAVVIERGKTGSCKGGG